MNKNYKELLKNSAIFTIGSFSSKVLIFLLVPFYTSFLSTEEYGYYDLVYITIQLLFPIFSFGISEGMVRFLLEGKEKNLTISLAFRCSIVSTAVCLIGLLVNRIIFRSSFLLEYDLDILLYYIAFSTHAILVSVAKGNEQIKEIAVSGVMGTVTMVALNILFLKLVPLHLHGFFAANYLSSMMASCYLAIKTKTWRQLSFARNKNREKQILLYSIPLVLNSLGWWANNTSDRYIVSFLCGVSITGLISAAYKIPSIVSTFGSFFLQAWQITAIKDYENNHDTTIYKDMFILQNAVLCILSGLFILFSKTFGNVFFSKSFAEAWVFAPLLVISALFNQAAGFLGPILGAEYKSNAIGKAAIAGLIINIIFNVVLTILIGPQGITIATAAASFIIFYIRERATNGAIRDHFFIAIMFSWAILCIEAVLVCFGRQFVIASVCVIIVFLIYSRVYLRIGKMLVKRITKKKSV